MRFIIQGLWTHTAQLLDLLGSLDYWASPAKAQLTTSSVNYLGTLLTSTSKSLTSDRIQALHDLQPPKTVEYILSFLGLADFFRHWVPHFALLTNPLYKATKETPHWTLTSPQLVANSFYKLRNALTYSYTLSLFLTLNTLSTSLWMKDRVSPLASSLSQLHPPVSRWDTSSSSFTLWFMMTTEKCYKILCSPEKSTQIYL